MTLSIGFRISVSLHPAILATGLLAFTPTGLSPAEHASLRWTHIPACGSLAPGSSDSLASAARHYHGVYGIPCHLPGPLHLPWPSLRMERSALPGSPSGANLSTLQDSLYVAGCGFALLSQEVTTLQHHRSPDSTGCLLRGCLIITATGLSPASR